MNHIRSFNEGKKGLDEETVKSYFLSTFDCCTFYKIDQIYYDPEEDRDWSSNDWSGLPVHRKGRVL